MRGIHTCCPEGPSEINITQNLLQLDGSDGFWVEQYLLGSVVVDNQIPLLHLPYVREAVQFILNTGTLRQGTDFGIAGSTVFLNFTPAADDKIHIRYMAITDPAAAVGGQLGFYTGMTVGYGSEDGAIPPGWLLMDGTTEHIISGYTALASWLLANPSYELSRTDTHFVLEHLQTSFVKDGTLVSGPTIIKT